MEHSEARFISRKIRAEKMRGIAELKADLEEQGTNALFVHLVSLWEGYAKEDHNPKVFQKLFQYDEYTLVISETDQGNPVEVLSCVPAAPMDIVGGTVDWTMDGIVSLFPHRIYNESYFGVYLDVFKWFKDNGYQLFSEQKDDKIAFVFQRPKEYHAFYLFIMSEGLKVAIESFCKCTRDLPELLGTQE